MTASCLLLLPLVSGCSDDKGGATQGSSTSDESTTGGTTDDSPTGGTTDEGPTGGGTSGDGTTGAATDGGTAGSDGTTGGADGSLCEGACDRLLSCEIEEDAGECLAWCHEWREDAAMADPRLLPGCAALVEEFFECVAQDDTCFESDVCSNLDLEIEVQCGCERGAAGSADECSYDERCGPVTREVHCTGGTCVCTVNGEAVGECQSQAVICADPMGPDLEPQATAAGECCGWVPFEPLH